MLGRAGRKESLEALGAAWDAGITFFDTARSYGYGGSEGLLGEFCRGRREKVFICTKFGILPAKAAGWKQALKPAVRGLLKIAPGLRGAVRAGVADASAAGHFSVGEMRESFETSLRELGTEYVDMLLMHAAPASVLEQDDLMEALGRLREEGKVRMVGISGEESVMRAAFNSGRALLTTAQFALNVFNFGFAAETRAVEGMFLVANHPFGGAAGVAVCEEKIAALLLDERIDEELREKLATAPMCELVLNAILRGTGVGAVIPAMMQVKHLRANVKAVEECRFSDEELGILREALAG